MIHLTASAGLGLSVSMGSDLLLDGNVLGLQSVNLRPSTEDYIICQMFVPTNFPSQLTTRFSFVGEWVGGEESSNLTFKVDVWHKGVGENLNTPDSVDEDIIIKAANEEIRIADFYFDIPPNTINGDDFVKIRVKRNNVAGDGRKLRISAVKVEVI